MGKRDEVVAQVGQCLRMSRLIYLAGKVSSVMSSVGQYFGIVSLLTFQENHLRPQL